MPLQIIGIAFFMIQRAIPNANTESAHQSEKYFVRRSAMSIPPFMKRSEE